MYLITDCKLMTVNVYSMGLIQTGSDVLTLLKLTKEAGEALVTESKGC